ncbi:MAG: class D sortase [Ruminococcus sp.]|nr:class D sortase [Ruminococcus sp.]
MRMNKKSLILHLATPFLLASVCIGILAVAMIKPADKLKVFVNIAFMDSLKSNPTDNNSGLVIRDNDIIRNYSGQTSSEGDVIRPAFAEMYAVLSCDAIGIDIPVYWGSNAELLEHGACQSSSSAIVGTEGNAVISAHVDTYFADLDKLKEGDAITINTNYGQFTYSVRSLIEFSGSDRKYITPKDDTRLTIYTCKKNLLGASSQRIGVICDLKESLFYEEVQK